MHVLGVVCSPRIAGNTELLVRQVLAGAESLRLPTRLFRLGEMTIGPCRACQACKPAPPCKLQDDMQQIYQAIPQARGLVLGSPIYLDHITAQAKIFIDRLYCYLGPALEHRFPSGMKLVAVLTHGHPDPSAYRPVGQWLAKTLRVYFDLEAVEVLYAPACNSPDALGRRHDLLDAATKAGTRLAKAIRSTNRA